MSDPWKTHHRACLHQVGDWVYNRIFRANVQVVRVTFEPGCRACGQPPRWMVAVPGLSDEDAAFEPARDGVPRIHYERTSFGWRETHREGF